MAGTAVTATPASATARWLAGLQGASEKITEGVNAVTTAPGVTAAKNAAGWLAKVTASQQKWAKNVSAVSLQEWQAAMLNVGVPRISGGAQAKQDKYQTFAQKFYPYLSQGMAKIAAMPNVTLQDAINRATAMIQWNAQYKG